MINSLFALRLSFHFFILFVGSMLTFLFFLLDYSVGVLLSFYSPFSHSFHSLSFSLFILLFAGAFQAPFPFIYGISHSLYEENKGIIPSQTVKIFLDSDVVDFGSCGPPPRLPEKRFRKLLSQLKQNVPLLLSAERRKETGSAASSNKGCWLFTSCLFFFLLSPFSSSYSCSFSGGG
jgi:hypothetical protein